MKYLLDTCAISEYTSKRPNAKVIEWLDALDAAEVYLCVLTIGELIRGIKRLPASSRKEQLSIWLHSDLLVRFDDRILDITFDIARIWGEVTPRLEVAGNRPATVDALVASCALANGCAVVTRNEADFSRTGVTVVNPWSRT